MGIAAILVTWREPFEQAFSPYPKEAQYEIWLQSA